MTEQLDLTAPVVPPQVENYRVSALYFDWDGARINIRLKDNAGKFLKFAYAGPTATTMMTALNKANLTSNSLHKRVLQRLADDGKLAGTISGSPA